MNTNKDLLQKTTLLIDISDEYKVKIEDGKEFSQSIFSEIYIDAFQNTYEIVRQNETSRAEFDVYNNIIVFSGERGKGKSSSMISFRNVLSNISLYKNIDFFRLSSISEIVDKKFASIDIIDPSLFKGEETLFEIIVAKMFSKFQTGFGDSKKEVNHDDKRIVLKEFQKVFNNLKVIYGGKKHIYEREPIEALSALAYGSNLFASFARLIDVYLEKVEAADYLIVAIDDFDLNMSDTYQMLEDIRQFLIQRRIIILISCKIEQVYQSVEYRFLRESGRSSDRNEDRRSMPNITINEGRGLAQRINFNENGTRENNFHVDPIKIQANKYVEKLFPLSHTLTMPLITESSSLSDGMGSQVKYHSRINSFIINIGKQKVTDRILWSKSVEIDHINSSTDIFVGSNLQDVILNLIYSKTGVFINKPTYRLNAIIPGTLRQVHSLIGAITLSSNSLSNLRKYLVDIAKNELPTKLVEIFIDLEKQDFHMMNLHFLNLLGIIKEHFDISNKNDFNYLLHPKNPGNISLADTYSILRKYYDNVRNYDELAVKFLDYISIYLAVRTKIVETTDYGKLQHALLGGYFNGYNDVFPAQRRGNKRRDWVNFRLGRWDEISEDERYWLGFFIPFLGVLPNDYRDKKESPYFRELNSQGGTIEHATFSPLTPLSHGLFPKNIWMSLMKPSEISLYNSLYEQINEWNESNTIQTFLNNNMFYLEFLQTLDEVSKTQHKSDGLRSYSKTVRDYMLESADEALDRIKQKYPYIASGIIDRIADHPVYKMWGSMPDDSRILKLIDDFFELSDERDTFSQQEKSTARDLLKAYSKYFNSPEEQSSRGAKQAMNTVVKNFPSGSPAKEKLEEFRNYMDEDLVEGLMRIRNYLSQMR